MISLTGKQAAGEAPAINNTAEGYERSLNIMIIDDKTEHRELIWDQLKKICLAERLLKPNLGQAQNGFEALKFIDRAAVKPGWVPDLFCVDINMPVMDGFSFCSSLKKDSRFMDVPIILFSDDLDQAQNDLVALRNREKGFQLGVIQAYDKIFDSVQIKSLSNLLKFLNSNKELKQAKAKEERNNIELKKVNQELARVNQILLEDLDLARSVQSRLLPEALPVIQNAALHYLFQPSRSVSGDFIHIYFREHFKDKLGIFICDVSGHGTSSAMISSMVRMSLDKLGQFAAENRPGDALRVIKKRLEKKLAGHFLTAYMGYLDLSSGLFTFARAGHPYLAVVHPQDGRTTIDFIKSAGHFINDIPGWPTNYEDKTIQLQKGDKLFLYTDGLTEAKNEQGEMLGVDALTGRDEEKLGNLLSTMIDWRGSPEAVCEEIRKMVETYTGQKDFEDDFTIFVLEYHGS